jgi:hypothetical protein
MAKNITISASPLAPLLWDSANAGESLKTLCSYVEQEARGASEWYFSRKKTKAAISRWLRFTAIVLTALAGLLPIITNLYPAAFARSGQAPGTSSGLWFSLAIGLAAALLGLDRFFGFSTGWIRYILAGTAIHKALEEFRMDWALLSAKLSAPPTADQIEALILRAKQFRLAIEDCVLEETKAWAAEFQSNLARLEKEAKAQLEAPRAAAGRVQN